LNKTPMARRMSDTRDRLRGLIAPEANGLFLWAQAPFCAGKLLATNAAGPLQLIQSEVAGVSLFVVATRNMQDRPALIFLRTQQGAFWRISRKESCSWTFLAASLAC